MHFCVSVLYRIGRGVVWCFSYMSRRAQGFWGGAGAKTPKFVERKREREEQAREAAKQQQLASRADARLKGVIINEKRDKKVCRARGVE